MLKKRSWLDWRKTPAARPARRFRLLSGERLESRELMAASPFSVLGLLARGSRTVAPATPAPPPVVAPPAAPQDPVPPSNNTTSASNAIQAQAAACVADPTDDPNQLTKQDVCLLLQRAAAASATDDAIIAIVDRGGSILGVRLEEDMLTQFAADPATRVFAIDGAVAKARTAAFFSNDEAPLTSRTVRFISQSTVTQREVESNPNINDINSTLRGPGFVAPIGVGAHFPPEVLYTPPVDLFAIEHQSRDSSIHPGLDGIKGTADDIVLTERFNVPAAHVPVGVDLPFPESYGAQSGVLPLAQSRGIATLPGGIPIFKFDSAGVAHVVGGIGVFFPGPDGFATHEQGFVPASLRGGVPQSELERLNAARVLEAEWIAFAAVGGSAEPPSFAPVGTLAGVPVVDRIVLPSGRIDLVGITLEAFGPHPTRLNNVRGPVRLLQVGGSVGRGSPDSGANVMVTIGGDPLVAGKPVPQGWLVTPHASAVDPISALDVTRAIEQGIVAATQTRAAIRLQLVNGNRIPGSRTKMVLAVADSRGEVLGLYRMPDATVFSIDVAVAKARNTAYYANAGAVVAADRVDDNRDGIADLAAGLALTNRTFRFLALPRYPSGTQGTPPGAFSMLRDPGVNSLTAENLGPALPASVYTSASASVKAFSSFSAARNFRDPTDIANQNGVVYFPGSSPLYKSTTLVGGLGVSGDGVDQDDVVTAAAQRGLAAPGHLRADNFFVRGVRLPFQKFNRNPNG